MQFQHIQNLEKKPNLSPRYLPELAAAFGKTVEELREWKDGDPVFGHHKNVRLLHLAEERGRYGDTPSYTAEEITLITHYRACAPETQKAIRTLMRGLAR